MLVISNHLVYLEIARETLTRSQRLSRRNRTELPGGRGIVRFDRGQRSFKAALIAIAFAGMYLEALLHLVGARRLGVKEYERIDKSTYEDKLKALGVTNSGVLLDCKRFRETRRDLMHEKAYHPRFGRELRFAQEEAAHAVALVERIRDIFGERTRA